MEHPFKDQDLVAFDAGEAGTITGRVVGFMNPASSTDISYGLYVVMLEQKLEIFPWSTLVLPGTSLKKLTALDELARADDPCPVCAGESLLTDIQALTPEQLEMVRDEAQGQLDDLRDTWDDALRHM